jgi:hypothetical protein
MEPGKASRTDGKGRRTWPKRSSKLRWFLQERRSCRQQSAQTNRRPGRRNKGRAETHQPLIILKREGTDSGKVMNGKRTDMTLQDPRERIPLSSSWLPEVHRSSRIDRSIYTGQVSTVPSHSIGIEKGVVLINFELHQLVRLDQAGKALIDKDI